MPLSKEDKERAEQQKTQIAAAVKVATVTAAKKKGAVLPAPWKGGELTSKRKKIFIFGHQGTGKDYFLKAPLRAGHRIFVISTDDGGNGIETVINAVRNTVPPEVLDNIQGIDLSKQEQISLLFSDTPQYIKDFDPTIIVLDGVSGMQAAVDQYVLEHESKEMKDSEMRDAGLVAGKQDWQGIARGTRNNLIDFQSWEPNGHGVHKIATSLQNEKMDKLVERGRIGPLLDGKARDTAGVGFGIVFQTYKQKVDDRLKYFYRFSADSDKYMVKCRGYDLPETMEADPEKVWEILTGEKPIY